MSSIKFIILNLSAVILILSAGNISAQAYKWEFALESGAGLRSVRIDPAYPSLITKTGVSFIGGVAGQYNFNNIWSLKLGASYERKGANLERTDIMTTGRLNIDYFSFPFLLKVRFGKKIRFFANAGPCIGLLLSSHTILHAYSSVPEVEINNDSTTQKTDFGIVGGAGIELPVGKSGAFTLEVRDNFSLTNLSESKEPGAPEIKLNTVNLILGFVFKFGKNATQRK